MNPLADTKENPYIKTKNTISIKGLRPIVNFASDSEVCITNYLKQTELSKADILENRINTITIQQEDLIYQNILELTEDPLIGLKLGTYFKLENYGLLGFTMMSSRNIGESINIASQYHFLSYTRSNICKIITHETSGVEFSNYNCRSEIARVFADRDLSASKEALCYRGRLIIPLANVKLAHSQKTDFEQYSNFFGCNIEFNHKSSQLHFDKSYLAQSLPLADSDTYNHCKEQCDSYLNKHGMPSLKSSIEDLIKYDLNEFSNLNRVAESMCIHPRTLRRKLEKDSTNFQEILQTVRIDMAKRLLNSNVPINIISESLGYSEPANFSNAFKRWTGESPRAFTNKQ